MLSVLIPTYNYIVIQLVNSIHNQLINQNIQFEILCFDNGSKSKANDLNDEMNKLEFCSFISLKKNGGRSKIRNLLAQKSKYDWLLFLDSDVLPYSENFITNYIACIKNDCKVVFGGLKYYDTKPPANNLLRWTYGKSREEISIKTRNKDPNKHFTSANFLINKKVFNMVLFDEELTDYGFEDTFLAIELVKNNISIGQLDNPVYHLGLDLNKGFVEKTKRSIENLLYLKRQNKLNLMDNDLLKWNEILKRFKLELVMKWFFNNFYKKMEVNLVSKKPSLFIYDLFRIGYLCKISTN